MRAKCSLSFFLSQFGCFSREFGVGGGKSVRMNLDRSNILSFILPLAYFRYLKPKSVVELQKNPPSEKNELENEIKKQQFLLEHLHGQVAEEGRQNAAINKFV